LQLIGKVVTLGDVKVDKYARRVDAYVTMPDGRDLGRALIAAGLAALQRGQAGGMVRAVIRYRRPTASRR
jgi:endonuclease YncB( thermonuclease family)